jgi:HEAT repeat protein
MSLEAILAVAFGENDEGDAYWDCVGELHRRGTQEVFERAARLCSGSDARSRQLGLDVLAQLGYEAGRPFLEDVLRIATRLANDSDAPVRKSALSALGHQLDVRALPTLIQHRFDPDPDVRWAVAAAIPFVANAPPDPAAVATLIALMRDADSDVRDWATFGLGSLLDVDGSEIRQALTERLGDPDGDTAGEALVGLARRRDLGIVERVRELLEKPQVGNLIVEAAGDLADPRLLPALERLQESGWPERDPRGGLLETAIAACRSGKPTGDIVAAEDPK